jgi:hypothetical protein
MLNTVVRELCLLNIVLFQNAAKQGWYLKYQSYKYGKFFQLIAS